MQLIYEMKDFSDWPTEGSFVVLQSKSQEGGTEYLLRVFVDIDRKPAEVVTAYRTSKVAKYWRNEP